MPPHIRCNMHRFLGFVKLVLLESRPPYTLKHVALHAWTSRFHETCMHGHIESVCRYWATYVATCIMKPACIATCFNVYGGLQFACRFTDTELHILHVNLKMTECVNVCESLYPRCQFFLQFQPQFDPICVKISSPSLSFASDLLFYRPWIAVEKMASLQANMYNRKIARKGQSSGIAESPVGTWKFANWISKLGGQPTSLCPAFRLSLRILASRFRIERTRNRFSTRSLSRFR